MHAKPLKMPIYMDHNATTPVDPRVKAAMDPYLADQFGNAASSTHAYGWQAQAAVRKAREQVAALVGCDPPLVYWTSGATESNNLAILGLVRALRGESPHIITQATEHKAVLEVCEAAEEWGAAVTVLPVDEHGAVRVADVAKAMRPTTALVSIMAANNEIGTLQPLGEIADLCRERRVVFHTDAAQGAGKIAIDLRSTPIDLLSLSGHKIYGPKGIGALIVRPINRQFDLKPIQFGGEQEKKLRPGTLNVPAIVGLGEACAIAKSEMTAECARLMAWQGDIFRQIRASHPTVRINGPLTNRLCNNVSLSFPGLIPDDMILALAGVAFSSGSACNSSNPKPSHVLKAIGLSDDLARATLRLGLGRFTSADEIQSVTDKILKMLGKIESARATVP